MTLIAPERQPTPPRDGIRKLVTPTGISTLQLLLNRTIASTTHGDSSHLSPVITESIKAFIDCGGDPELAATRVAPLLWEVGDQHALRGLDAEALSEAFRLTQAAAQRGLRSAVGSSLSRDVMSHLREDVILFIRQLNNQALIGWERTHTILAMPEDERRSRLGRTLLQQGDESPLQRLAEFAQVELSAPYVVVVSAFGELPRTLLRHPDILAGSNKLEALVPASWIQSQLSEHLESPFSAQSPQVVVGPSTRLADIAHTASLTRRGAELLRDGLVADTRTLVPCSDLLGSLVVNGNPTLTELVVAKHLGPMESMRPTRRLAAGALLLQWLERGLPMNKLARDLEIPRQTAHDRMKSIRARLGDAIDDPNQRLELIVALQATLPRWRAEAGE